MYYQGRNFSQYPSGITSPGRHWFWGRALRGLSVILSEGLCASPRIDSRDCCWLLLFLHVFCGCSATVVLRLIPISILLFRFLFFYFFLVLVSSLEIADWGCLVSDGWGRDCLFIQWYCLMVVLSKSFRGYYFLDAFPIRSRTLHGSCSTIGFSGILQVLFSLSSKGLP